VRAAEFSVDNAIRRTVYRTLRNGSPLDVYIQLTRSSSAMRERKSNRSGAKRSSYVLEVSAKVYRIAAMTVALVAGLGS
jgi:hypothetical protein